MQPSSLKLLCYCRNSCFWRQSYWKFDQIQAVDLAGLIMQFQTNDWWHFLHSLPWSLLVFMLQKGKVQSDFYTSVVTAALKLWVFFNALKLLSQHLIVQSQQWKHKNRVWNIWKVNNKYTRMTSCCSFGVFIVNFEQISHIVLIFPLLTLNKRMPAWHNANLFKNFITFLGYVKRLLYFFCVSEFLEKNWTNFILY